MKKKKKRNSEYQHLCQSVNIFPLTDGSHCHCRCSLYAICLKKVSIAEDLRIGSKGGRGGTSWQLTQQEQLCISLVATRLIHARQSALTKYKLACTFPTACEIINDKAAASGCSNGFTSLCETGIVLMSGSKFCSLFNAGRRVVALSLVK